MLIVYLLINLKLKYFGLSILKLEICYAFLKEMIDFRLWNSTLVEDYPKVDMVKIGSNARIVIPASVVIQQENLKDDHAIVSIFYYINI